LPTQNASLQPIYERLNSVNGYHPMTADTFADWSVEAGDIVTVSRENTSYSSPVNNTRVTWRGTPKVMMNSTGSKEREPVARTSQKKYGSGGGGAMANQRAIHYDLYSEDGVLHSELDYTESKINLHFDRYLTSTITWFESELEMTASHLEIEFDAVVTSVRSAFESELEMTYSHLEVEIANNVESLRSDFELTASELRAEFTNDVESLRGEMEISYSHLQVEFEDGFNSLRGELEVTASHLQAEFDDGFNSLRGELELTASHLQAEFEDGYNSLRGELEVTASHLQTEFSDDINSVRSEMEQTASSWAVKISGVTDENGNVTAASIAVAINASSGQSEAIIDADKVYIGNQKSTTVINGKCSLSDVTADVVQARIATLSMLNVQAISSSGNISTSNGYIMAPNYYIGASGHAVNMASAVRLLQIVDNGNNSYTLQKQDFDDAGWVDVGTFNKAASTTLDGSWSGAHLTVTASPQDIKYHQYLLDTGTKQNYDGSAYTAGNTTWWVPVNAKIDPNEPGSGTSTGLRVFVSVSGGLQDDYPEITQNGTYYPDTGKYGFSSVTVNIPSTSITPVISHAWSNTGQLTVSTTPAAQADLVRRLGQSAVTWSGNTASVPVIARYGSQDQYSESTGFTATVDATARYNAGWDYGITQHVRTTRAATSQELTIKNIDYGERFSIVDTYTNSSGTQSSTVYTVEGPTDRYSEGQASVTLNNPAWSHAAPYTSSSTNTVTVTTNGRPTQLSKSVGVTLTPGEWSSGNKNIDLIDSNGGTVARLPVTIPAKTAKDPTSDEWVNTTGDTWKTSVTIGGVERESVTKDFSSLRTAGYNSAHISKTWGTGNDSNKVVLAKTSSGSTNSYTLTVTAGVTLTYDSSTHKYTATGKANCDGGEKDNKSTTSGTEAYEAGKASVGVKLDTTNKKVMVDTTQSTTTEYAISAAASISYNATTHKYTANATAKAGNTSMATASKTGGTEAYDVGYSNGWTGCYNTVGLNTTTQQDLGYGGSVTIYAQAKSSSGASSKTNVSSVKVTAPADRYETGWAAAYAKVAWPGSGTSASMTVKAPAATSTTNPNQQSVSYTVSADNSYAYIKQGTTTVARVANGAYANGQAAVTLNDPSWTYSNNTSRTTNTVTVSTAGRPTQLSKSASVTLTAGAWSSGSKNIDITDGGGNIRARIAVTIPAVSSTTWTNTTGRTWRADLSVGGTTLSSSTKDFNSYYTGGYSDGWGAAYGKVAWPGSGTAASMTVKAPAATSTTNPNQQSVSYTVSADNTYCYIKQGSTTVARATHSAYSNGANSVTLSAGGWSGGNNVVTASNSKTVTVTIPTITSCTLGAVLTGTTYNITVGLGGTTKPSTVNCAAAYNAGWNACLDACTAHSDAVYGIEKYTTQQLFVNPGSGFSTWKVYGMYGYQSWQAQTTLYEIPARK